MSFNWQGQSLRDIRPPKQRRRKVEVPSEPECVNLSSSDEEDEESAAKSDSKSAEKQTNDKEGQFLRFKFSRHFSLYKIEMSFVEMSFWGKFGRKWKPWRFVPLYKLASMKKSLLRSLLFRDVKFSGLWSWPWNFITSNIFTVNIIFGIIWHIKTFFDVLV